MQASATLDIAALIAQQETKQEKPSAGLITSIKAARDVLGDNRWLRDAVSCMFGPGKLSIPEYLYYRLYDEQFYEGGKDRFVGNGLRYRWHGLCNDPEWIGLSNDKTLFYSLLRGEGLPQPETRAIVHPMRRAALAPSLSEISKVCAFLGDPSNYPLFAKPADGNNGIGAIKMMAVDGESIQLVDGSWTGLRQMAEHLLNYSEAGYLLQSVAENCGALCALTGTTLATMRLLMTLSDGGVQLQSAVIKLPRDKLAADNYWQAGNLLGAVNRDGRITRAVSGAGLELSEHENHPETGHTLIGTAVPGFQRAVDLASQAAVIFPKIRTQSWDLAMTDAGPMLIELNANGAFNIHQIAHRRGMFTPEFAGHLRACGYKGKYPEN